MYKIWRELCLTFVHDWEDHFHPSQYFCLSDGNFKPSLYYFYYIVFMHYISYLPSIHAADAKAGIVMFLLNSVNIVGLF